MTKKDLARVKKKYERMLAEVEKTTIFVEEQQHKKLFNRFSKQLAERKKLELVTKKHCSSLLHSIERELAKR